MVLVALVAALFAIDNKEYFDTVEEQQAAGFSWSQINCRQVDPELPALTIKTPTGKEIVCNKLVKD